MTEDEETPQEWLHRIMDTSSREAGDYDINLLGGCGALRLNNDCTKWPLIVGIFHTVDCHTLFLPATKKVLLQDLSKVILFLTVRSWFVTVTSTGKRGGLDSRVQRGEGQTQRQTEVWTCTKGKEWSVYLGDESIRLIKKIFHTIRQTHNWTWASYTVRGAGICC